MSAVIGGSIGRDTDLGGDQLSQPKTGFFARRFAELREATTCRPGHEPALDGLRGVAVGLVFLVHIHRIMGPLSPPGEHLQFWLWAIAATGQVGVLLFFALSGFLIHGIVLSGRLGFWEFLRRRFMRIYPTFLVVALLHLLMCYAWPPLSKLPEGMAAQWEYIARAFILLPGLQPDPPLVTVAWTLRYEVAFYLLMSVVILMPWFFRLGRTARIGLAVAVLALLLSFSRTAIASMFVFGILAYEVTQILQRNRPPTRAAAWLVAAAVVPASLYMHLPELASRYPDMPSFLLNASLVGRYLILGPLLGGLVVLAALGRNPVARFAAWMPVRVFGIISYSYYLSHGLAIHFVERVLLPLGPPPFDPTTYAFGMFAVSFVLSLLVALVFFLGIEFRASLQKRIAY